MSIMTDLAVGLKAFEAPLNARLAFLRKTYLHLFGAVGVFIGMSWFLTTTGIALQFAQFAFGSGFLGWILMLGGFFALQWIGTNMAFKESRSTQYAGLGLYTGAFAFWFSPMLGALAPTGLIGPAAVITAIIFAGITFYVLTTKKDFKFLGGVLFMGMFGLIGVAVASAIFGFQANMFIAGFGVMLMSGFVLWQTSEILHRFRTDQYVGASLILFGSVILLFMYVLRLLSLLSRD